MDRQEQSAPRRIDNVGVLDLRHATAESLKTIGEIANVGTLFYSSETAALVAQLNLKNVGTTQRVSADARLINGQVTINRQFMNGLAAPISMVVNGELVVLPDVTAEEISQGLNELYLNGRIICPENLAGVVQSKLRSLSGDFVPYPVIADIRPNIGTLVLDEAMLRGLGDGARLLVVGSLRLPNVVPNELLSKKLAWLQVVGKVLCHEENLSTIMDRLQDKTVKLIVIPTGFSYVDRELRLDNGLVSALPSRKLYSRERIIFEKDVDPATLDQNLDALVVEDLLVCPEPLRGVIGKKCNLLNTRTVFYSGDLMIVEDEFTLTAERLAYLQGQVTLLNNGVVNINPDLEAGELARRLARVHNQGVIQGTAAQLAAISSRPGIQEGQLVDTSRDEESGEQAGNIGVLEL